MTPNLDSVRIATRLARNWWAIALGGVVGIIFGLTVEKNGLNKNLQIQVVRNGQNVEFTV